MKLNRRDFLKKCPLVAGIAAMLPMLPGTARSSLSTFSLANAEKFKRQITGHKIMPSEAQTGDIWFDTYSGRTFVFVGEEYSAVFPKDQWVPVT